MDPQPCKSYNPFRGLHLICPTLAKKGVSFAEQRGYMISAPWVNRNRTVLHFHLIHLIFYPTYRTVYAPIRGVKNQVVDIDLKKKGGERRGLSRVCCIDGREVLWGNERGGWAKKLKHTKKKGGAHEGERRGAGERVEKNYRKKKILCLVILKQEKKGGVRVRVKKKRGVPTNPLQSLTDTQIPKIKIKIAVLFLEYSVTRYFVGVFFSLFFFPHLFFFSLNSLGTFGLLFSRRVCLLVFVLLVGFFEETQG